MTLLLPLLLSSNFTTPDAELRLAAEAARWRSAVFWTGRPLPADWSEPCPVRVRPRPGGGAGGTTSFRFDRGHVTGWRMTLEGPREGVLLDAVPHEVDHMVRATLVRRPVVRWLDEGAAALFESPHEHRRHRRRAASYARSGRALTFLTDGQYPTEPAALLDLYSVGFSLTEFLITRVGPARVLDVMRDSRPLAQSLPARTGLNIPQLVAEWRRVAARHPGGCDACPIHRTVRRVAPCECSRTDATVLTVWTARWCPPCRSFWRDLRTDAAFRSALGERVHFHWHDADAHPEAARRDGVRSLPTFLLNGRRLEGYPGKAELLARIDGELERVRENENASGERRSPEPADSSPRTKGESTSTIPDADSLIVPVLPSMTPGADAPGSPEDALCTDGSCGSGGHWLRVGSFAFSAAQAAGLIGGTAATGGLGLALFLIGRWRERRRPAHPPPSSSGERPSRTGDLSSLPSPSLPNKHAPFPRALDETRELLRLRQREGRVAALDALRGMVVDDELERLSADPAHAPTATKLRSLLDDRVGQIAPISTRG